MERCESCGSPLEVGIRQTRRIRSGHSGRHCRICRGGREVVPSESDYRYWLSMFGVKVRNGASALEVVRASGLPPALAELAVEFDRDSRTLV